MRRPIAARNSPWARRTAKFLAQRGVRPNVVSAGSVVCALIALLCLLGTAHTLTRGAAAALFLLAAGCIQLRLLCNLFDGMIAVEFGQASRLGPLFNDFPDRPADLLILVGCGCALSSPHWGWQPALGWLAGALAIVTAYVRVLGVAVGAQEYFDGPMAKQQRMAVATGACGLSALEAALNMAHYIMAVALLVIFVGCIITIVHRLVRIARDLQQLPSAPDMPVAPGIQAQMNQQEHTNTDGSTQ